MKDLAKMRLGVLREIKNIRIFFDRMERKVKSRNTDSVQDAYVFIKTLAWHMDNGDLTPFEIELHRELLAEPEDIGR